MRCLRVNGTKVTLRNAFIDNAFALESEAESENDKKTFFPDCMQILDMSVNP